MTRGLFRWPRVLIETPTESQGKLDPRSERSFFEKSLQYIKMCFGSYGTHRHLVTRVQSSLLCSFHIESRIRLLQPSHAEIPNAIFHRATIQKDYRPLQDPVQLFTWDHFIHRQHCCHCSLWYFICERFQEETSKPTIKINFGKAMRTCCQHISIWWSLMSPQYNTFYEPQYISQRLVLPSSGVTLD
jgi:hypothetical protein